MSQQRAGTAVSTEPSEPSRTDGKPAEVWLYQLVLQHYRLPVWDQIVEKGGDDYRFTVWGPLGDGECPAVDNRPTKHTDFTGESAVSVTGDGRQRSYLRHNSSRFFKVLGAQFVRWPDAAEAITRECPDVVILSGNIRNFSSWRLPYLCRKLGIGTVEWGKVHAHSYSTTPQFISRPIKRRFFRGFDSHICYGRQSADELMRLGVRPEIIHVAQNTIDTDFIFNDADEIAARARSLVQKAGIDGKKILTCVGSMVRIKRQLELIDAWPRLRDAHGDLVLVLVGGGQMLEEVRDRARQVDPQRIVVTGRVPDGDDHCWLAASDISIVPGGAGLSINSSLALGKPTIIADEFGSDAEIVEHGVTGWRYPLGNLDEMVKRIEYVLAGGDELSTVTLNARKLMREKVTIDHMADGANAAIRQALQIGRKRKRCR